MNTIHKTKNKTVSNNKSKTKTSKNKTVSNKSKRNNFAITKNIEQLLSNKNYQGDISLCPMMYVSLYVLQQILYQYSVHDIKNTCNFIFFDNPNIFNLRKKNSKKNIINSYNYEKYIKKITTSLTNNNNTISIHVYNEYSSLKYKNFIKKYCNIDDAFLVRYKNIDELVHISLNNKNNNLTIIIFINKSGIECDDNTLLLLIYMFINFLKINNSKNKMFLIAHDKYNKDSNFNVIKNQINISDFLKNLQNIFQTNKLKPIDIKILNYITKINYLM